MIDERPVRVILNRSLRWRAIYNSAFFSSVKQQVLLYTAMDPGQQLNNAAAGDNNNNHNNYNDGNVMLDLRQIMDISSQTLEEGEPKNPRYCFIHQAGYKKFVNIF